MHDRKHYNCRNAVARRALEGEPPHAVFGERAHNGKPQPEAAGFRGLEKALPERVKGIVRNPRTIVRDMELERRFRCGASRYAEKLNENARILNILVLRKLAGNLY